MLYPLADKPLGAVVRSRKTRLNVYSLELLVCPLFKGTSVAEGFMIFHSFLCKYLIFFT